jgi:hypothetical protein
VIKGIIFSSNLQPGRLESMNIGPASMSVSRCEGSQEYIKFASNLLLDFRMDLGFKGFIENGAGNGPGPVARRKTAFLDPCITPALIADPVALKILGAQVLKGMFGQQVVATRPDLTDGFKSQVVLAGGDKPVVSPFSQPAWASVILESERPELA